MKAARTRALNKKHAGTTKHSSTAKHTPTAKRKSATAAGQTATSVKKVTAAAHLRAWSPDSVVPLCTARAFAETLRIALGRGAVSDAELLDVYRHAAVSENSGASILATAEHILAAGLGGCFPLAVEMVDPDDPAACILGLDMPEGRHTVAVDPSGGVWSWGGLYELTDEAVVEEAWAVRWL